MIQSNKYYQLLLWLIVPMLYFVASVHYNESLNMIALYGVIPLLTIITLAWSRQIFPTVYFKHYLFLLIWLTITLIWARDSELAMMELKAALGAFMLSYVFGTWATIPEARKWLYLSFVIILIASAHYAYTEILPNIVAGEDRLSDDDLNANVLAYYSFYLMIALFILGEIVENKPTRLLLRILALLSITLTITIGVLTASRQVLAIQAPLFLLLVYVRYFKDNQKLWIRALMIIFAIATGIFIYTEFSEILSHNLLLERIEESGSDDERMNLLISAYDVGLKHPFTGVGAGNFVISNPYEAFAHNTFAELWANTGIIGLVIFTYMLGLFLFRQLKYYRETKHILFIYFLLFGIFFLFYQMLYVFYASMWLMGFFMLIASHSESLYLELQEKGGDK